MATNDQRNDDETPESQYQKGVKQLYENGHLHRVPKKYILSSSDRPTTNMEDQYVATQNLQLPIIDFADLLGPNRPHVLQSLANACENYGFFQVGYIYIHIHKILNYDYDHNCDFAFFTIINNYKISIYIYMILNYGYDHNYYFIFSTIINNCKKICGGCGSNCNHGMISIFKHGQNIMVPNVITDLNLDMKAIYYIFIYKEPRIFLGKSLRTSYWVQHIYP